MRPPFHSTSQPMSVRREAAVGQGMTRKEEVRIDAVGRGRAVTDLPIP